MICQLFQAIRLKEWRDIASTTKLSGTLIAYKKNTAVVLQIEKEGLR
jgi:hypothetical protein